MPGFFDCSSFASVVCIFLLLFEPVNSDDKGALLAFVSQITHSHRLRWDSNGAASFCSWIGVRCDSTGTAVHALRLPGIGLSGVIPGNTIGNLSQLRVLSLRSNRLSGSVPADFENLRLLRSLYLQDNNFSGYIPASVIRMNRLTRLNLSYNKFMGDIPLGLTRLNRLTRLDLSWNRFVGGIPSAVNNLTDLSELFLQNNGFTGSLPSSIQLTKLLYFNVSNNKLNGSIPPALAKFSASSFRGNLDLCGPPSQRRCKSFPHSPSLPSPSNAKANSSGSKLSKAAIIAISLGSVLILIGLIILLILCLRKRDRSRTRKSTASPSVEVGRASPSTATAAPLEAEKSKLVFLHVGRGYSFNLEDLLRASAEVLGKGSVGTSYKAVLEDGTTVVVKRLKDIAVTQEEFERRMEIVGQIDHENVVPPRAYYYSRDEKLLVSDYIAAGTLSALLHGIRGSGRPALDWGSRLRIAVSAVRGLLHLHRSAGTIVHGNVKSSNILLREDHTAAVSDFGLLPLFGTVPPPNRAAGYRAPEIVETSNATVESDVYGFGVVLLELVTGKSANQMAGGEEGIDLPRWARAVVREEWTAEVFDSEVVGVEEEMVRALQIALACVATVPAQRPEMAAVLGMLEEVRLGEGNALVVPP